MDSSTTPNLKSAISALRIGDKNTARSLILIEIRENSSNLTAWLWALEVAENIKEKQTILNKILSLDPTHKGALQYLKNLDENPDSNQALPIPIQDKDSSEKPVKSQKDISRAGGLLRLFLDWVTSLPSSCGFFALFIIILGGLFFYFRVNTSLFGLVGNDFDELVISNSYEQIRADDMYWEVQFEGLGETKYIGIVRHASPIRMNEFRILTHDVLVTTADFANPDIVDTSVLDHKFFWNTTNSINPTGSINLIHAVPANKSVYQELLKIQSWDTVKITGREIYTVKAFLTDETFIGTWVDTGCNTLLIESVTVLKGTDQD
ncbi:MAG: hypothetical protein HQ574_04370 [Chloroflexi bacterium]|nr:hypothetical protein [Chloroflexota bacterium]